MVTEHPARDDISKETEPMASLLGSLIYAGNTTLLTTQATLNAL